MQFLLGFIIGFALYCLGFWMGWRQCDRYWTARIRERPDSIQFGRYPWE